jgi:hypothetical protein
MDNFKAYFQEAKAYFISCHQHPINQMLHHLTVVIGLAGAFLLFYDWRLTAICLFLTLVIPVSGHLFFEKNEPAFKKYRSGIMILASLSWSWDNWLGFRSLLKPKTIVDSQ